jgi:hypothetical protein
MGLMEKMEKIEIPSNAPALYYSGFNNIIFDITQFLCVRSSEVQGFKKRISN